jgi:protein-disulfide isomerase
MTLLLRQRAASVLLFVSAALVGCGDDTSGPPVADTQAQATGGDLVSAAQSGTLESTQGMSTAPPGSGGAAPDQSLDIASLGYNEGPADAPVRVLEFSDFGCGYCRRFHEESYPALVEEYMEAGKVEWKYVPIILGMFPNAMEAARAGECAGEQGAFPRMEGYARELDLDVVRFRQCVNERWRDQRIQAGTQLSRQVGVRGTPTFFVVGYAPIPGAIPLDLFRAALDTVYAQSMREPEGG